MRLLSWKQAVFVGAMGVVLAATCVGAMARSGGHKYAADYSDIRGFNYNTASSLNTEDEWRNYKHAEVDRDFGYAERIQLNSVRVFLAYKAWLADKTAFRENLRDFVRTAAAHHIGVMVEVVNGPGGMMPDLFEESAKPKLREYARDLVDTIGEEPGLSFWDIANEPDWVRPPVAMPNTNQPQRIAVAKYMAGVFHEFDHHTPVTIGCLYLTCTMETASYVDVLSYHDYSQTRAQIAADIVRGQAFAASVRKPLINTEMACVDAPIPMTSRSRSTTKRIWAGSSGS